MQRKSAAGCETLKPRGLEELEGVPLGSFQMARATRLRLSLMPKKSE